MSSMLGAVSLCKLISVDEVAKWSSNVMNWTLDLLRTDSPLKLIETMSAPQVQGLLELPLLSMRQLSRHSTKINSDEFSTPRKSALLDVEPTFGASLLAIHSQFSSAFLELLKQDNKCADRDLVIFEQFTALMALIYGDSEPHGQPTFSLEPIIAQLRVAADKAAAPMRLSSEQSLRYLTSLLKLLSQSVAMFLEPRLGIDILSQFILQHH